jgi:hypothetical protein
MDPYLERHWPGVHLSFVAISQESLNRSLPDDLVARIDERVYVETNDEALRMIAPDLLVISRARSMTRDTNGARATTVAAPVLLELNIDPEKERFIEIRDRNSAKVITTIEFLSPANKAGGDGTESYRKKRDEILDSDTNLVEIDLVRAGDWQALLLPFAVPEEFRTDYRVCVSRAIRREKLELYPIRLRDPLPQIAIPLRASDPDVVLDLQAVFDRIYESGRYDASDYQVKLSPPLNDAEAKWAAELLGAADKR